MQQGRARKWVRRALLGLGVVLAVSGIWAGINYSALRTRYAAHRLQTATTDEDRSRWADALIANPEMGLPRLIDMVQSGDPASCSAAAAALDRHLNTLPDGDPRALTLCGQILDTFAGTSEHGRRTLLDLVPTILKHGGMVHAGKCKTVITAGLTMPGIDARLIAIRLAMNPDVKMRGDLVPLLTAPEPEVRRAALFAVGPATDDEPVLGDEDLFRWLHDADEGVRQVCYNALTSRGRTESEITLGRRLSHPDPTERLKLLLDLRYDDDVADPEPWLERLSRDPEPGVRAGAVRVAVEVAGVRQLPPPGWVASLADSDPLPSVRRVAAFFRMQPTTGSSGPVRQVGGP